MAMTGTKAEAEERVDTLLLEPLAGLKRGKDGEGRRMSAEAHAKMLARLRSWLAYLDDEQLAGMRDHIVALSVKDEWPTEAQIRRTAMILKPAPPQTYPYVRNMMTSRLGFRAVAEGWAFEMYQEVKRHGPPPFVEGGWKEKQLREEAVDNQRRLRIAEENIAARIATEDQKAFHAHWHRDMAEIRAMQDEKRKEGQAA